MGFSQNYAVHLIPDSIKKNADIVVRHYEQNFTIKNSTNVVLNEKYVITFFSEKAAQRYGQFNVWYDKFEKINKISTKIYNKSGKLVSKSKKKDIHDYSSFSGSFFDDNRIKVISPVSNSYPYSVEYEYTKEIKQSFSLPTWTPYLYYNYNIGVEKSKLSVTCPNEYEFRKKEFKIHSPVVITETEKNTNYTWQVNYLTALNYEQYSPPKNKIFPHIKLAPNDFEMDGYKGNMETWQNFGTWLNLLNKDRNNISEETEEIIKQMVSQTTDTIQMIKAVYEYMQSKTRYVSIQVGIGGFQPFEASFVDEKGYGDCKALSNYTKSLLEITGIKSNYTIVQSGFFSQEIDTNFPSNTFNHAILCVPLSNDTIWLECTSQKNPFGYIGTHTDNRNVLIVTENGGKMVRTKKYTQNENVKKQIANVQILENSNAIATITTNYKGLQYDDLTTAFHVSPEEQKKWIYSKIDIPDYKLNKFSFTEDRKMIVPSATENLELEIINYTQKSGDRLFVTLNLMNKFYYKKPKSKKRTNEIYLRRERIEIDSITYQFPDGYKVEYAPEKEIVNTKFGDFEYSVEIVDNKIVYTRILKMNAGLFPSSDYVLLIDFFEKIAKADKQKVVLVKKE